MKQETDQEGIDFDLPDNDPAINERLKSDPEFRREFAEHWLLVAALEETLGQKVSENQNLPLEAASSSSNSQSSKRTDVILRYGGWLVAALVILGLFVFGSDWREHTDPGSKVSFTSLAQASFFGELTPAIGSTADLKRDYSLVAGSVELSFPDGATTIVEAPAVFRVEADDWLALDVGSCSVHAPPGAEGFRVDTPNSRVIDRGTRFLVNVSEASETEVQVVEGAADIHPEGSEEGGQEKMVRLTDGEARLIARGATRSVPFSPEGYRASLPDRVVSYEATPGPDGKAQTLASLTVQRGGKEIRFSAECLIPIELTSFYSGPEPHRIGHIVGRATLPTRRASLMEDLDLHTGIINPGGTKRPLSGPFEPETTPGFSVRFRHPVQNQPGPDIVLFEIQNESNPPEGDAFHVSPLSSKSGLRSITISRYDLMLTSSSALPVSERFLHQTSEAITSLSSLEASETTASTSRLRFYALAVGIDLSELGYAPNETVSGLFFQDAMDDDNQVDPMVIVGLPAD